VSGSSSFITDVIEANTRGLLNTITGKVLSTPNLTVTDGVNLVYACDVDIGQTSVAGVTEPLRNVPIAPGNLAVVYAGVGCAVTLTKGASGQYQITGFAQRMPGTYTRLGIDPATGAFGPPVDISITVIIIPLDQLQFYGGGFGIIPLNATAVFQGGVLLRIQS
jgi:hypothetical protein